FIYKTNDGTIDSQYATVSINIEAVNDAPVLDEISPFSITEDILLNGTFIATDADSDDILTFSTSGSLEGFTLEDNGTFSFNPSHLIYQSLNVGDEIIQSIPIIVTDGILDVNKSFNIQITGQNDVPIAHYDYNQTNEDSNLSFNLLINDIDVDNNATLTLIDVNATEGNFTFTADGNLTFFPNGDYDYLTENQERNITLVYMIEDEHHEASEANVTISIHGINNAPTITAIDSITIDENISTGIGQIVASDAENSSLTFESNSTLVSIDNNGTYTFDTDGLYDNLAEGETKIIPIMITISDGVNSITRDINVTIIGVNTPPTVEIGADYNITEGDTLSFGITSSEDVDGSITQHRWSIDGVEASTATSVEHTFTAQGTYTVTLIVTDDKNATGSDSLIVTVNSLPDVNTISFTPHTVTMSAIKPEWLEMVDLDQDGDLDILTAGDGGTKVGWYENRGDFSFTEHSIATTELEPEAIKVADMDSDGDLDILYTTYNDSGRSLIQCLNDGSESFTTCSKITDQTATAVAVANISFIEIAYINDDTKPDIVSSSWGTPNTINWYENLGDGNYSQAKEIATLSNVPSLRSADINGDTYIDIVAASHGENRTVWYENDGNGTFTERAMPGTVFGAYSVEIMDKSNDGDIDVISTSNTDGKISIHHNDGTSTPSFTTKAILAHHLKNIHYASGADMDNDGDIDIIAASSEDNGRIAWYENIQDNLDYPEHNITLGVSNIVRVFAADIDNDGNMDIVSCAEDGNVTFYENNEADPLTLLPKTGATMLTAGDDGDLQKGADYTYTKADRIVTNNITDLMWQYDSSEHGADTIYQSTAVNNCKNLNITGYNDWRLPEIHELYYLLDRRNTPAISSIFDGTQTNDGYWVSDNKNGDYSWVDFLNATGNISYIFSFPKKYVRCVRGKKYEMKFIRNDTLEIVTDHKHNLQWQDNAVVTSSAKTWNEAIDYCSALDLDGTGWRLPNINELYSIVKLYQSPAIHESFVNTTTDNYWSSTADASGVVAIYFWHGVDNGGESVDSTHKVRCVRDVI
ncbi:MAG TPA: DUF1566 domain-containing protein, partial [Campylobacterales bacterium]|nr:DUF1566 domain-containing protein [Campylobacterales bacterium]